MTKILVRKDDPEYQIELVRYQEISRGWFGYTSHHAYKPPHARDFSARHMDGNLGFRRCEMSVANHGHDDDVLREEEQPVPKTFRAWNDPHPPLRQNYIRLLSPEGYTEDVWKGYLESALEGLTEPHDIFASQRAWDAHVQWKRDRALLDLPCSATKN